MSKKKIGVAIAIACILIIGLTAYTVTGGFEEKLEKKVVGEWVVVPEMDGCDPDLENGIRMNEDGTIEGILGFTNYRVEETDQENSHLIVDGGYEDLRRYKIQMDDKEILTMHNENVSEGLTCKFEKVE